MSTVRIDKWLWAARFYKTRNIAKQAIEGGKVQVNGQRAKASKDVELGSLIRLRQGWDIKEVKVLAISNQRRGAPEAAKLYQETPDSIAKREQESEQRQAIRSTTPQTKPNTKQRRMIHRFKREILDDEQN